jgi:uncharacterized protein YegL
MNFEFPTDPRKALEDSLTALLLGELPDEQVRFLRQAIATDPELAKTFEALKKTIELVRETEATPVAEPTTTVDAPKLSDERRDELLQRFKTVQPAQFKEPMRPRFAWLMPVAAAVALIMIVSTLLLPVFSKKPSYMAQRSLGEPGSGEQLNNTDVMGFSALRRGKAPSKLADDRIVQRKGSTVQYFAEAPPISSAIADKNSITALQSKIILPAGGKPESESLGVASEGEEKRDWGYQSQTVVVGGEASLANPAAPAPALGLDTGGGGGMGGGAAGNIQNRVPILGDTPLIGRLSRPASTPSNAPDMAGANNRMEFLGYDDPGSFVPQAQAGLSGIATPLLTGVPLPHFRALTINEQAANQKDEPHSPTLFGETQQQYSAYYGGGSFGGLSTVEPSVPQPGQRLDFVDVAGVRRVPIIRQSTQDSEQGALGKEPAIALPSMTPELAKSPKTEVSQKVALAELDDAKEKPKVEALKVMLAKGRDGLDESKKEGDVRSKNLARPLQGSRDEQEDLGASKQAMVPPEPQPETQASANPFSTFSLNVSDVSFKLAAASLEKGVLPDPAGIRSEEFINAFDYRDTEPPAGAPVAFAWERSLSPFAQNRDLLRFSIKTAAGGRQPGRPLNVVLLLDNSGSMERADRVSIIHEALRVLATQLGAQDTFSVVTFARTARLWVDGIPGDQAGRVADELSSLTPQGGTNLEEAMNLAYQTALRHYTTNGINRVVLLTDGAANLGDTDPEALKKKVETNRKQGIALDCFGIGWEGYNDDLLEVLTRNGDGRYGFLNTPEEAASGFADQLAGALHVAANDVKVQVEFNTNRVTAYRQIGYARHQLTKEQFRDNTVNAAAIGAAESGNALYAIESNPQGAGPLAVVHVRYRIPGSGEYREQEWTVPYTGVASPLEQASPAMRLSATAGAFSEWLATSPYAAEVTPDRLLGFLNGVPSVYGADPRPQKLQWMMRQAKAISGK